MLSHPDNLTTGRLQQLQHTTIVAGELVVRVVGPLALYAKYAHWYRTADSGHYLPVHYWSLGVAFEMDVSQ